MDIVIDTSVIIAVIVNEPQRDILIQLTREADLLAPHSVHWEVGNAFSAMLKRRRITVTEAQKAVEIYQKIPLRFVDIALEEALQRASDLDIYAYDAYIISCALKYKAPLMSLDRGLIEAARQLKVRVIEVS